MYGKFLHTLLRQQEGATGVLFGLMILPVITAVGFSIDISRAYSVRTQLQESLDAATLAGGRAYALPNRNDIIKAYFDSNWKSGVYGATTSALVITDNASERRLRVSATANLAPIFSRFVGLNTVTVGSYSEVIDSDTTLEIALAIDTTGSMDSNDVAGNHKMTSARNAANTLLNILYAGQNSDPRVFVSVVPFVQNVNVGSNYSSWLVAGSEAAVPWNSGPWPTSTGWRGCMFERLNGSNQAVYDTTDTPPATQRFRPYSDSYLAPTCVAWSSGMSVTTGQCVFNSNLSSYRYFEGRSTGTAGSTAPTSSSNGSTFTAGGISWRSWYQAWRSGETFSNTGNIRANPGTFFYYDNRANGTTSGSAAPSFVNGTVTSGGVSWRTRNDINNEWRVSGQIPSYDSQYGYGYNSGCGSAVVPLTNNRLTAKARVDALQPSTQYGGTMTNVGLMWGWRTISPNWQGLWSGVPADRPMAYDEPDNYKALIILTDGDNVFTQCSTTFCRGAATPYGYLSDGRTGSTSSGTAVNNLNAKVTQICNNARAQQIRIYAVMFALPSGASSTRTLFQNCVGTENPDRFFDVSSGTDLNAAFQAIGSDLTQLRLSE